MNQYKIVYSGFDTLEVTFQGMASEKVQAMLDKAKEEAQDRNTNIPININGLVVEVFPTGATRYRYSFTTGVDGETWFVAKSKSEKNWGIRVKVNSAGLAENGYKAIKDRLYKRLELLEAKIIGESIGRVDFAVDVLAPDLKVNPELVVCHSSTSTAVFEEKDKENSENPVSHYWSGRRCTGVTIGAKGNRQVGIYDKTKDSIKKKKHYWFNYWGIDRKDKKSRVWRVEARGWKDYLRKFDIKTFDDFENSIADVFKNILKTIRYVDDKSNDTNFARRNDHPIWDMVYKTVKDELFAFESGIVPTTSRFVERETMKDIFTKQIRGLAVSYAYLKDVQLDKVETIMEDIFHELKNHFSHCKEKVVEGYNRARNKYIFVNDPLINNCQFQC